MTLDIRNVARDARARLVEIEDAPFIVEMRGNAENSRHLSPIVPDIQAQERWLREYKQREHAGIDYYFVVISNHGENVGLFRLYNINRETFTAGSWIVKKDAPARYAVASTIIGWETGFYSLDCRNCLFSVSSANERVIDFHRRNGAIITRHDRGDVHFIYSRESHEKNFRSRFRKYYLEDSVR